MEKQYRILAPDETIQKGDEWKTRQGLECCWGAIPLHFQGVDAAKISSLSVSGGFQFRRPIPSKSATVDPDESSNNSRSAMEIERLKLKLEKAEAELNEALEKIEPIGQRLLTQDNRITAEPMFCVEIKVRDTGLDSTYSDNRCWWNAEQMEVIHDDDPDFKEPEGDGWDEFGYRDRWETVMVAFTEAGCKEYLDADGHNVRRQAFRGEVRIYVKSFHRCAEMIEIRKALAALAGKGEK